MYLPICTITGALMANCLFKIEDWDVLLLEAGGNGSAIHDISFLPDSVQSEIDWKYRVESNELQFVRDGDT